MRRSGLAGLLLAFVASAAAAEPREDRGAPAGRFDFYVVSLSWSATYCALTGERRGDTQCAPGRNPGFVLHGLWPQYERGYPAYCRPEGRSPSRAAMEIAERVYPSSGLARHEWRKHGTCSGESPGGYFEASAAARARIRVPEALAAPREDRRWGVIEIERAFAEANPGLRPDMMAVTCTRGQIEEIRLCLTRDLRAFRACEEVDRDSCRARDVLVPAAR
ncbi:ribonuclease T2 family protein [Rhabdaerophilum calidifontis]|uniref:ribonuclease T2 family protein n=1 Tax=Rhabdaerophilum calidifontis TaxID=2604328 RepID=UPI001238B55E|nr:ribonuclease T2 [Rhabdaerophilum calidifontis]